MMVVKDSELLTKAHRLVVKVGTSTLTYSTGKLNLFQLERLVREIADLRHRGLEIVLVTSGAIGAGMGKMGLVEKPKSMPEKQALAAIGQGILMHMYEKLFGEYGEVVAQVLLTRDDVTHRERYLNARNTLLALFRLGAIPIINENDTVVVEEIKFGENDTLSALVAGLADADLLVLLSDIDGLYTADPHKDASACLIPLVKKITPEIEMLAGPSGTKIACGGMATKINAAKIATGYGIPMIVANGARHNVLREIVSGNNPGTLFLPGDHRNSSRKSWIAHASKTKGTIWLDEGAQKAILEKGKSLLPSGITRIEGQFQRGHVVCIMGSSGEIGRGIVNYGSNELEKIKGRQSKEIAAVLGYKDEDEVIHRDNLSLTQPAVS
ncbi:MAG: glutamate 5-kinase [Peptococcaceae bacterium]|jgi:glutamate 5-kinase|nr:glutamate 5-kinase [Peptococcaceae bacterium]MDH7524420.1 glutamate 5-kinase [Peptococcaceae bacterium]